MVRLFREGPFVRGERVGKCRDRAGWGSGDDVSLGICGRGKVGRRWDGGIVVG